MNEGISIWRFVLCGLAVWRVTHLLAEEDGPWDVVVRIRGMLGLSVFGQLMDCFYCLSVWVAVPFAFYVGGGWIAGVVEWLAMSAMACLLERATAPREAGTGAIRTE